MLKSVTVTNYKGERLSIALDNPETSGFIIRDIDGIEPTKASISLGIYSVVDGGYFKSARSQSRDITLDIIFCGSTDPVKKVYYRMLREMPRINSVPVESYKQAEAYGLERPMKELTESDIDAILDGTFKPTYEWPSPSSSLLNEVRDGVEKASVKSYNDLYDKPKINGVVLYGDRSSEDLALQETMAYLTETMIDAILDGRGVPWHPEPNESTTSPTSSDNKSYLYYTDKPKINGVILVGNKTGSDLGLQDTMDPIPTKMLHSIIFQ